MAYKILVRPVAQRQLDDLPTAIQEGLRLVLRTLADEPRGSRFDLKAIAGRKRTPPYLRLRVGDYRIILQIDHAVHEILVARIGHRKDVYRGVEELDE